MQGSSRVAGWAVAAWCAWAGGAAAEFRFHRAFSDHMVLQRGGPVRVFGLADKDGETVSVSVAGQTAMATVEKGRWTAELPALEAGGPHELTATLAGTKLTLKDVLVGDVWICSGQSNMEWSLSRTDAAQEAIAASKNDKLRLFEVKKNVQDQPLAEPVSPKQWQVSGPESTPSFSAVGYYFGRMVQKEAGVPVGMLHTSWGGTVAEAWTSHDALEADERLRPFARKAKAIPGNPNQGSVLYNGMLVPLAPMAVRGAIWYQGESNASRAFQYRTLFQTMIVDWRKTFASPDMPFYFVQLAPWDPKKKPLNVPETTAWPELREAQRLTTLELKNTGMAVVTDTVPQAAMHDIHPTNKKTVGERLAALALADVYGKQGVSRGPEFAEAVLEGSRAIVGFGNVGGGLVAPGGPLLGFALAGPDGKFHAAEAKLDGNRVVVSSKEVKKAEAVRFGWADFPVGNLFNKEGFPASPFRTDNAKWVTDVPYVAPVPKAPAKKVEAKPAAKPVEASPIVAAPVKTKPAAPVVKPAEAKTVVKTAPVEPMTTVKQREEPPPPPMPPAEKPAPKKGKGKGKKSAPKPDVVPTTEPMKKAG